MTERSIVIFDLGGVLINWDPRHLYRRLFKGDEAAMEQFLATVCTPAWNLRQDAGRSFADAEAVLIDAHPQHEELIRAWRSGFNEMIPGALDDVVEILAVLKDRGTPLYALSNWSAETFVDMPQRFPFLTWFRDIAVSGQEKVAKPDRRLYDILLSRNAIPAERAVFIDDAPANVEAASALGLHAIRFSSARSLRAELVSLGLL